MKEGRVKEEKSPRSPPQQITFLLVTEFLWSQMIMG